MNLPKLLKHYFPLFLLIFFLIGLLTAKTASAMVIFDGGGGGSASLNWFKEALKKKEQNLESFVGGKELLPEIEPSTQTLKQKPSGIVPGVANSITAMILGVPLTEEEIRAGYLPNSGAVGGVSNLILAMYASPPASGVEYLADLGRNLGIIQPVYAQAGVGFQGLSPILKVWKAFRNIAYLFFVIIFVVIGFAIMFRVKISPQAVITIQSALPRIIMALILVTFSYAIAGFLIDLIYVFLMLGIAAIGTLGGLFTSQEVRELQQQFTTGGFPNVIGAAFYALGELNLTWIVGVAMLISAGIGATVGGGLPGGAAGALVGGGLFLLLLAIVILYVLIKLFIELLKAYIGIIIGVIFAPLQIMLDVLPGQSGFGNWFRNLIANILVFPAVAIFLLIARVLVTRGSEGDLWTPPLMGGSGAMSQVVVGLIGLGMLLMVYKIPEMIKQMFQIKPFPYGAAIGEAFGPGRMVAAPGAAAGGEELIRRYAQKYRGAGAEPPVSAEALRAALNALVKRLSK